MKTYISTLLFLLVFVGAMFSCNSTNSEIVPTNEIETDVFLNKNEAFSFDFGSGVPNEGGYSIAVQAEHYEISQVQIISSGTGGVQFNYQPETNFRGIDRVEVKNCISAGSVSCNKIELYIFNFHIK